MNEIKEFIGIDISKATFDVYGSEVGFHKFENTDVGFKSLLNLIDSDDCCVMEVTGGYHNRLAEYLHAHQIKVSVVNPVSIKRYGQMRLKRNKSDKADAQLIWSYACNQGVKLWEPLPAYLETCRSHQSVISLYLKQSTQLKNKLQYLENRSLDKGAVARSIKLQLSRLTIEIQRLENEIEELIKQHDPQLLTCLRSIPGIGKKTAMFLIVFTNGLSEFDNAKQLISYLGLAPTERTSGTSIRGKSRISKAGNPKLRSMLFLCSFTAYKHNESCHRLYERLLNKGKTPKLALIAVANKLLKQAYAISKSRIPYDATYCSPKPV